MIRASVASLLLVGACAATPPPEVARSDTYACKEVVRAVAEYAKSRLPQPEPTATAPEILTAWSDYFAGVDALLARMRGDTPQLQARMKTARQTMQALVARLQKLMDAGLTAGKLNAAQAETGRAIESDMRALLAACNAVGQGACVDLAPIAQSAPSGDVGSQDQLRAQLGRYIQRWQAAPVTDAGVKQARDQLVADLLRWHQQLGEVDALLATIRQIPLQSAADVALMRAALTTLGESCPDALTSF